MKAKNMSTILGEKHPKFYLFHEKTKIRENLIIQPKNFPFVWKEIFYKEYPRFPRFPLPLIRDSKNYYLEDVLLRRKSDREFTAKSISLTQLSKLLYFSAGINRFSDDPDATRRMYPSGGARYPLEIYLINFKKIDSLGKGIYHYHVQSHSLELLFPGSFSGETQKICGKLNRPLVKNAAFVITITAVFGRTTIKYGDRGYRLILLEGGHLGQNIYLISTALNLGCCAIGGFLDDAVNKLLDLEMEKEQVIYMAAIGTVRK